MKFFKKIQEFFQRKATKAYELVVWSWVGGSVSADGVYAIGYFKHVLLHQKHVWNWADFSWLALAGVYAPIVRAINPRLSEFGLGELVKILTGRGQSILANKIGKTGVDVAGVTSNTNSTGTTPAPTKA